MYYNKSYIIVFSTFMLNILCGYAETKNITLIADRAVLAIPITESHEPMVDLKQQTEIAYGPSPEIPHNTDYTKIRKAVYEKLIQAQRLLPAGLHFCLYEGYRSIALQQILFNKRLIKNEQLHPNWELDQVFMETTKLVSPVTNLDGSRNIPPHSTGGAIDIYLVNDQGKAVDMGIHPKDWVEDNDTSSFTASNLISVAGKKNRLIMSHALSTVGFVNYPTEYWHWSYGDRYWAFQKKISHAIYN